MVFGYKFQIKHGNIEWGKMNLPVKERTAVVAAVNVLHLLASLGLKFSLAVIDNNVAISTICDEVVAIKGAGGRGRKQRKKAVTQIAATRGVLLRQIQVSCREE